MTYINTILNIEEDEKTTASVKDDLQHKDESIADIIKRKENEEEQNSVRHDGGSGS